MTDDDLTKLATALHAIAHQAELLANRLADFALATQAMRSSLSRILDEVGRGLDAVK